MSLLRSNTWNQPFGIEIISLKNMRQLFSQLVYKFALQKEMSAFQMIVRCFYICDKDFLLLYVYRVWRLKIRQMEKPFRVPLTWQLLLWNHLCTVTMKMKKKQLTFDNCISLWNEHWALWQVTWAEKGGEDTMAAISALADPSILAWNLRCILLYPYVSQPVEKQLTQS